MPGARYTMPQHARVYNTEAIVLRRTDFGEADRILTLFTPAYGKVRAVAKGIRRPTSRLAGHLEPFTRTRLLLATGRELDIVTQAEAMERLDRLRDDLWHATAAWYAAELVDRFLADNDAHPRVYQRFTQVLGVLDACAGTGEGKGPSMRGWLAVRHFELHLLDELGYRPALHRCAGCEALLRPEENGYNAELGGCLCPNCSRYAQRRISLQALKVLRLLQGTEWEQLPRLRLDPGQRAEVEGILQSTLRAHLERDLRSWSYLNALAGG
jgi:DNA repair protein RecO (recombination protein O)